MRSDDREQPKEFVEKLVKLNRTAKTVKGGRRMAFSALTVVGDQKGRVGYGFGKANDVSEAIRKSIDKAKRNLVVIAGGAVRAVMDAAGITDVVSKSLGSNASVNVVRATFDAISNLMDARSVAQNRGKTLKDLWG